jgi:hypothetical protein
VDRGKTRKLTVAELKEAVRLYVLTQDALPGQPTPAEARIVEKAEVFFEGASEVVTPVIDHVLVTWVE